MHWDPSTHHRLVLTSVGTDILPIETANNQAFVLQSWGDFAIKTVTNVPPNGFNFLPESTIADASCVVYLNDLSGAGGKPVP
ncbi:hypothetical protein DXG01_016840, partial [Tephrocybe rancida]